MILVHCNDFKNYEFVLIADDTNIFIQAETILYKHYYIILNLRMSSTL